MKYFASFLLMIGLLLSNPLSHRVSAGGSAGHPALQLPGEGSGEASSCPYCTYYSQLSGSENLHEHPEEQHHRYQNSRLGNHPCHGNSPCQSRSPCYGNAQVLEPRKKLWERCWAGLRIKLKLIVSSRYFNRGIMIAILINTLSMGIEYHEQVGRLFGFRWLTLLWMCLQCEWRANHFVGGSQQTCPPINTYSSEHMGSRRVRVWKCLHACSRVWVCAGVYQETGKLIRP